MNKNITNIILSVFVFITAISVANSAVALTLTDITDLLDNGIINPTQASLLMKNSYMFAGPPENTIGPVAPTTPANTNCINLVDLDIKSPDRDSLDNNNAVTSIQNFLYRNGYLEVAPTGYYGNKTIAAVRAFQTANGIRLTGQTGPLTRAKMKELDCGSAVKTNTITSIDYINPTLVNNPDALAPTIVLNAYPEQVITGERTVLEWYMNNAVGQCDMNYKDTSGKGSSAKISQDSSSSVPVSLATTFTITCFNKYGIPGSKSITVTTKNPIIVAPIDTTYIKAGHIDSVNPSVGNRGDIVTISGSGFLPDSEVIFDGLKIDKNSISSQSDTQISFKVPEYKQCSVISCPLPSMDTNINTGGKKVIQVANVNGFSNDAYFTITGSIIIIPGVNYIPTYLNKLNASAINPTSGNRGDIVTISGSGFSADSIILFGGFKVADNLILSKTTTAISFIVPPFQLGCTNPDYEICPRLPIPGSGTIVETGGDKQVYVMSTITKATTTPFTFTLPLYQITF